MKRLEATVHGRVQGVFFRQTTQKQARSHNLTGWVRNEPNGSVRVVAEGDESDLRRLERFLHTGPDQAQVQRVDVEWHDATGEFSTFRVRH